MNSAIQPLRVTASRMPIRLAEIGHGLRDLREEL